MGKEQTEQMTQTITKVAEKSKSSVDAINNSVRDFKGFVQKYIEDFSNSFETQEDIISYVREEVVKQFEYGEDFRDYLKEINKTKSSCTFEEACTFFYNSTLIAWIRLAFEKHQWEEEALFTALNSFIEEYLTEYSNKHIVSKPVEQYKIPKNKVSNLFWSGKINNNELTDVREFTYSNKKEESKEAIATMLVSTEEVKGTELLTKGDNESYYNAIYSLWKAGNHFFTNAMLYKIIMGKKVDLSENKKREIDAFINRASTTRIEIDATDLCRVKGIDPIKLKENLLNIREISHINIRGEEIDKAWQIISVPILGSYAEYSNQIISIPVKLLDTGTRAEYNPLKVKLIKEIAWIKSNKGKKRSNNIKLETLYEDLGYDRRDKQQRARENAITILDHFKKEKWIDGYKLNYVKGATGKKTLHSISIYYKNNAELIEDKAE